MTLAVESGGRRVIGGIAGEKESQRNDVGRKGEFFPGPGRIKIHDPGGTKSDVGGLKHHMGSNDTGVYLSAVGAFLADSRIRSSLSFSTGLFLNCRTEKRAAANSLKCMTALLGLF